MSLRTDRVRAIGLFKARGELTPDQLQERAMKMVSVVRELPIFQENLLKYEVSVKTEQPAGTLASALGLQETEFSVLILVEAESHEKIRAALTDDSYRKLLAGALEHITTREDFHFFPAEFITAIDK
ncbi:hypothetical protein C8R46DRAFT_270532 [Mycena filopes]|nr:hypothetical protein C8R46DRAFT_1038318 [Mycena filopes]KAJ7167122.1 hypothetical protein C8R46DRAFT_270532 [Mycena filopes]